LFENNFFSSCGYYDNPIEYISKFSYFIKYDIITFIDENNWKIKFNNNWSRQNDIKIKKVYDGFMEDFFKSDSLRIDCLSNFEFNIFKDGLTF